jgi:hypothetical protein
MNIHLTLNSKLSNYLQNNRKEKSLASFISAILNDYMNNTQNTVQTKEINAFNNNQQQ